MGVEFDRMEEIVFLDNSGGRTQEQGVHPEPMYKGLSEVLGLITQLLEENGLGPLGHSTTLESGVFEEHVVFLKAPHPRKVLFRMWPVLFPYHKRLEYRIYEDGEPLREQIVLYLQAYAQTNRAELIPKL
jgi:hypothetical protein